jgi:hypothetical protein
MWDRENEGSREAATLSQFGLRHHRRLWCFLTGPVREALTAGFGIKPSKLAPLEGRNVLPLPLGPRRGLRGRLALIYPRDALQAIDKSTGRTEQRPIHATSATDCGALFLKFAQHDVQ